ncbi:hypothetical protein FGG08_002357 [Glutinoglossum americanum]|uniref:Uncharacterized protein n=1 Tax=Glutinoglossum americanum TaxID=1670608 RepID=A0A9P8I0A2_9PEZI|nr:hypothetical protein FGG08_002357 [Glutinoglossum americanum]
MDRPSRRTTFFSLPAELRLRIYSCILPRPRLGEEYLHIYPTSVLFTFDFHVKYKADIRNILRTCRIVHAEFSEFLYQHTKFVIIDRIAEDELWLKRYIHIVRHLEIKVTSYHPLVVIVRNLKLMFRTIAMSQHKSICFREKPLLSSLTINLEFIRPLLWDQEKQGVINTLSFFVEDRWRIAAREFYTIRGLQDFDISGLETEDTKELLDRLRDRVTRDIVLAPPQQEMPFAQRMSAAF